MASDFTEYFANILLDHTLRAAAWTPPATVYVALFTVDPGTSGEVFTNEVSNSGTAYARQAVAFNVAGIDEKTENTSKITFPTATASWGVVTHFALCNSATWQGGQQLFNDQLTASKTVGIGDTFEFAIGAITVEFLVV